MSRRAHALAAIAAAALAPALARAQAENLRLRASGQPVGIAIPGLSVAGAEEPTALSVNPAGAGFVESLTFQYFHEGRGETGGQAGDGVYLGLPIGGIVPTLSMEWMRPGDRKGQGLPRFRRTAFGLAFANDQVASFGLAGNWYSSPDRAVDSLFGLDAGFTLRPWRHLSLGIAALGMSGRLGGRRVPIRYDFGAATRLLSDALTLSADLLTDDGGSGWAPVVRSGAAGLGFELGRGYALAAQLGFPLQSGVAGPAGSIYGQLAVTFNGPHAGVTLGGGGGAAADRTWLAGARLSTESYRSPSPLAGRAADVDVSKALSRGRSIFGGDRDPYAGLLSRLIEVREDGAAAALVVRIDDLPVGMGRADELRRELLAIRAVKPVVAYVTGGGMKEYWVASAATRIVAPPSAAIFPSGLASTTPFIQGGLARLGIAFDVVAAGRYKNAPDPLVRTDMSAAQREATGALLDDVFEREVKGIAEARRLDEARVRALVDEGVFTSDAAREKGLIDAVAFPDELERLVSSLVGRDVALADSWDRSPPRAAQRWGRRRAVAMIRVEGVIAQGKSRSEPLGSGGIAGAETIAKLVKAAADDRSIVAIVLRIDSPGGDGLASDLIWREVMQARRRGKPVVASMGDLAASGGYFVAVAADEIVAEPSTITGSIGVFSVKPDVSGLLQKLSVNPVTLKRGAHADAMTLTRAWTPEERKVAQDQVLSFYDIFLSRVASGRRLERARVDEIAAGRPWTGNQARERGLVDRLGTLEDALALAAVRAGYGPDADLEVRALEPPRPFLDLAGALGFEQESPLSRAAASVPGIRAVALLGELGPVLALPEEWLYGGFDRRAPSQVP
jgi:protease IV